MAKFKYRLWCNTENAYVYVWADSVPSECPNDSGHTINDNKTAIIQTVDEYKLGSDGGPTLTLVSPDGLLEQKVSLNNDGTLNIGTDSIKLNGSNCTHYAYGGDKKPYVRRKGTSYGVIAYAIFEGTNISGTPGSVHISALVDKANVNYSIRITNSATGDVIVEKTGMNNEELEIIDMGTITNLSTGQILFEIQGKCDAANAHVQLSNLLIRF